MKVQKNTQEEIEATMNVADEIERVLPPAALKGKIMARIEQVSEPLSIPFYRRTSFAAAAAIVILVLNVATVLHFWRPGRNVSTSSTEQTDPIAEIRTSYSLDETTY
ncbi:MAG: hypothetical protein RLZZ519_927 [Bacteroidota bacterium]|jgi:hypothetical protein